MHCPVCKTEYPGGVTRCGTCNVELFDASGKGPFSEPSDGNMMLLWSGENLPLHGALLEDLKTAEIPYFSRPVGNYSGRAFPNRRLVPREGLFGFEVSVLESDLEKAKEILQKLRRLLGV
jgi:hypothetical protein